MLVIADEFYKMIGTADLLGNPIGLIDSLATGVFALFYEPAAAVFKHPADITIEDRNYKSNRTALVVL